MANEVETPILQGNWGGREGARNSTLTSMATADSATLWRPNDRRLGLGRGGGRELAQRSTACSGRRTV